MKKITSIKKALIPVTFIGALLLIASCGNDQKLEDTKNVAEQHNDEKFDNDMKEKDAQFLVDAAEGNMKEIQLGQLAQKKGTNTHVKELGKMMEDAHTKSQKDLVALAKVKGITIPTSPTKDVKDAYDKLDKKSGKDFDKTYADMIVDAHVESIDTYEKAAADSRDSEITNWASKTLPELRKHHVHAIECQKKCDKL